MAVASLVIGLISLAVGFCCGLCGSPFPIIGLILGVVAMTQSDERGLAIAGIVINALGIVVIIAMLAVNSYFVFGNQAPGAGGMQSFQDLLQQPLDATDPPTHDPGTAPDNAPDPDPTPAVPEPAAPEQAPTLPLEEGGNPTAP